MYDTLPEFLSAKLSVHSDFTVTAFYILACALSHLLKVKLSFSSVKYWPVKFRHLSSYLYLNLWLLLWCLTCYKKLLTIIAFCLMGLFPGSHGENSGDNIRSLLKCLYECFWSSSYVYRFLFKRGWTECVQFDQFNSYLLENVCNLT